jgi:hypothetical protein
MKNHSSTKFAVSLFLIALVYYAPAMPLQAQQAERQEALAQGISATVPANWSKATELRNARELRAMKGPSVEARILTTIEPRTSHADALRRLSEIAAEAKTPVNFIQSGGWPAVQYRITAPLARTGQEKRDQGQKLNHVEKQLAGPVELSQRSVTAVAAGSSVIRIDAELSPSADPKLLEQAETMGRNLSLEQKGPVQGTQKELELLRKGVTPASPQSRRSEVSSLVSSNVLLKRGEAGPGTSPAAKSGATDVQSGVGELEMAVSKNGRNVVIGANSGYSFSTNGGTSFTFGGGTPAPFPHDGDPSLGVGASGSFYYGFIGYPDGSAGAKHVAGCAVGVSSSADGGATFPFLNHAAVCPQTGPNICFTDQPHIAADRYAGASGGDQLYAVWRNFTPSGSAPSCGAIGSGFVTPEITCSADGGQSWTSPAVVGSGDFARLTVGPDSSVYVVYRSGAGLLVNKFSSCSSGLAQQTGFPIQVSQVADVTCPVPGLDRCNDGNTLSSQMAAVDENDATHVFAAFAEHTSANNEDIWLAQSRDGGTTWDTPEAVNAAVPARRYMPWVCTSGSSVWVSWYDRRAATAANNDLTDYFSFTGGLFTVLTETNLSTNADPQCASGWPCGARSSNDYNSCSVQPQSGSPGGGCPKYGDYNGNACANGTGYFAWASATAPPGVIAPGGINVFFASQKALIVIPICVSHPWICYGEPNPYPLDPWIEISSIILDGVIQEINVEQNTVVIRVNNIYTPEFSAGITERTITASFRYASSLQVGQHLVFFASGASSGASAQPEILGLMAPEKTQDLSAAIARSSEHVREEKFKHRIESAELVVTGEVTRVAAKEGRAEGKDKDDRDKDKDNWNVATVQISRVLKGHHSNKTVNVVFPQGTAARWVGTPRFEVGDKGIWILRREHEDENYRAAGFQDFLLLGDLSWVEKLLK